ncbi:MAG: hypothetical protein OEZ01_10150 [Candidatus Heimdallarchaeota archaeon]|nr:hypothetical protein [Candidatus Heimdallarchaeota archaeon]MDH5646360.1 hypothetical protein [Candidatus Heimdallarchaeota archaeon]
MQGNIHAHFWKVLAIGLAILPGGLTVAISFLLIRALFKGNISEQWVRVKNIIKTRKLN